MNRWDSIRCVLFDLDGTLVDTAPDMVGALNALRDTEGLGPLGFDQLRNVVSQGALGLLRAGMPAADADQIEAWRLRFLDLYAGQVCRDSVLFEGMAPVLEQLERAGRLWGVVTNKPRWLTEPLLRGLDLEHRTACLVCGDDLPRRKPHPDPLIHACETAESEPSHTAYVGDAESDIRSARAAGCESVAATYGYIESHLDPSTWGADAAISHPEQLTKLFNLL